MNIKTNSTFTCACAKG